MLRVFGVAAMIAALGTVVFAGPTKRDDKLDKKLQEVRASYADKLEAVLVLAVQSGQKPLAEDVLEKIARFAPAKKNLAQLRAKVEGCEERTTQEKSQKDIAQKLKQVGEAQAKELLSLAQKFYDHEQVTRAYDLVGETLDVCPDQKKARDLYGFDEVTVDKKKVWVTKYDAGLVKTGHVLFKNAQGEPEGWIPAAERAHWEKGERPVGGRWVKAEDELRLRQASEADWFSVESEHFLVKTPVSRAAAYEFGQKLERFHAPFFRTFVSFYDTERSTELLFNLKPLDKKHVVLYFADKVGYDRHVTECHEDTKLLHDSVGFYSVDGHHCEHCTHFYRTQDGAEDISTVHHEVTHQLFDETSKGNRGESRGNNWVVEGLASYVETWAKDKKGAWIPGGNHAHYWLRGAKRAIETSGWKLESFATVGYERFHETSRDDNYALSCALVHFLMHAEDGRYREDAVRFFALYYKGKATERSLFDAVGVEASTLEKQLREYVAGLGNDETAVASER